MLPFGMLAPHPGWGKPRHSRLTLEEERTQLTLLAIARSPLILGANLAQLDDQTRLLITNREVISVDQSTRDNHPIENLPAGFERVRVWIASGGRKSGAARFLAIFNLAEQTVSLETPLQSLGFGGGSQAQRDLWMGAQLPKSNLLKVVLPAHACILYRIGP
jgi:alpha-galactosidase